MLTTTRVEAIVIDSDDGSSTFFRNDGDLVIELKKGRALGDQLGAVLVRLGMADSSERRNTGKSWAAD